MTKRQLEVAKKQIITARNKMDLEARTHIRVPLWRGVADFFGWHKPRDAWLRRWETKHNAALKRATHNAIQIAKRGGI